MRRLATLTLALVVSVPLFGYSFHLRVTDAYTAMEANPRRDEGPPPDPHAAESRVLLLERVEGANFVWLMLGWPKGEEGRQYAIHRAGGTVGGGDEDADFTLIPKESGLVTVRCRRTECRFHVTDGGNRRADVTLKDGQSADLPLNADYDVELED